MRSLAVGSKFFPTPLCETIFFTTLSESIEEEFRNRTVGLIS
jgi:hypothetical protein